MDIETQPDHRKAERRTDSVTARILRKVFSMRRGGDDVAARDLLASTGHDEAFIGRVLSIREERRGKGRRSDAVAVKPAPADTDAAALTLDEAVVLGEDDIAALHRLRFESDTGMHRMRLADCPSVFARFGLVQHENDGIPTITAKGREALRHVACVRALDSVRLGLDVIPMSDEVRAWLDAQGYLAGPGARCEVTASGLQWLALHGPLPQDQPLS
jgi:hypothetical protein